MVVLVFGDRHQQPLHQGSNKTLLYYKLMNTNICLRFSKDFVLAAKSIAEV
jgi:hypothetical protein